MKLICYLLPAMLSTEKERNEKDNIYKILSIYAKYCLLINLFMMIIFIIIGRSEADLTPSDSIQFYAMYIVLSMILSWSLPIVLKIVRKNFSINIKGIDNEKK